MRLVYLAGEPGAGKSTLMSALTTRCQRTPGIGTVGHERLIHPRTCSLVAVELGRRRDAFGGTDALSMSVMPRAQTWISAQPAAMVLGEGDRLASLGFLLPARDAGYEVTLVHCTVPAVLAARRRERRGSNQDAGWVAGRRTKTLRLIEAAHRAGLQVVDIDCRTRPELAALRLREAVPELEELP